MMKETEEDRALAQMFDDFRPRLSDDDAFMDRLERSLDVIEYVRQLQERKLKRTRRAMLCAFGGGLVVGCALYATLMPSGDGMPSVAMDTHFQLLRIISEYSHLFTVTLLGIMAMAGIMLLAAMWQDIYAVKDANDIRKKLGLNRDLTSETGHTSHTYERRRSVVHGQDS